jgi:hypothetical protein
MKHYFMLRACALTYRHGGISLGCSMSPPQKSVT